MPRPHLIISQMLLSTSWASPWDQALGDNRGHVRYDSCPPGSTTGLQVTETNFYWSGYWHVLWNPGTLWMTSLLKGSSQVSFWNLIKQNRRTFPLECCHWLIWITPISTCYEHQFKTPKLEWRIVLCPPAAISSKGSWEPVGITWAEDQQFPEEQESLWAEQKL